MKPQLCTDNHQRIAHVIAGISHINQLYPFQTAQVFPDCQHICQHLCRMVLIGQTIPDRNSCMLCQLLHNLLTKAPVLNSVVNSSQHPRRIGNTLFLSNLRAGRLQICGSHSHIMGSHFKGASCSGTGFLKNQSHIFASVMIHRNSFFFLSL